MDPVGQEVPLCTRCLQPVRKSDYYCKQCGQAVGQYTVYLPFIGIPFDVDFLAGIWRWTWRPERNLFVRVLTLVLLLPWALSLVVVGLPFLLVAWWRRRRARSGDPD